MVEYLAWRLYRAAMPSAPPKPRATPVSSPVSWPEPSPEEPWTRYRENVARHLIGIARDLQGRVMTHLQQTCGYESLRPSFGPLISLVAVEGRPLSEIASQLAISPQAASQLVNLTERAGYLERRPDPADRRARLVLPTETGRGLIQDAIRIIGECESSYRALVGEPDYTRFLASLGALHQGLCLPTHAEPTLTRSSNRSAGVLTLIAVHIERDLMESTAARGHAGLKMSHGQILPLVGPNGARMHELARLQGVSRQAIGATAGDLESLGYLRREPDPNDRRGVVLRLTDRGTLLISDSVASLDDLDRRFREILGSDELDHLQRAARELYRALRLEEEIFETRSTPDTHSAEAALGSTDEGGRDMRRLAARLRRSLGHRDAARLAALLEPRPLTSPEHPTELESPAASR